ncbi:MAG: hypothetical protein DME21_06230 [Verrucomicrobia bacterium]|nr:MAG: hypothetical protein DME21_06230 [Verrucomicrobiota bacterium]
MGGGPVVRMQGGEERFVTGEAVAILQAKQITETVRPVSRAGGQVQVQGAGAGGAQGQVQSFLAAAQGVLHLFASGKVSERSLIER